MPPRICVLGGGIIGLSTALRLQRALAANPSTSASSLTIVADKFGDETTSHGAAGLWEPYYVAGTSDELVARWGGQTLAHLESLYHSPEAARAGVSMITGTHLFRDNQLVRLPPWRGEVTHFREMAPRELRPWAALGGSSNGSGGGSGNGSGGGDEGGGYTSGHCFSTYVVEARSYLPYLRAQLEAAGVVFQRRTVRSVRELVVVGGGGGGSQQGGRQESGHYEEEMECFRYDLLVNCSGLQAASLFDDKHVFPIRGQVVLVRAPHVQQYTAADSFYVIPNRDVVVCGGISQKGDWCTEVRADEVDYIIKGCKRFVPSLEGCEIVSSWAGLRPGRTGVRLELEEVDLFGGEQLSIGNTTVGQGGGGSRLPTSSRRTLPVVHNYGHGGSGHTLHWGCAADAVHLAMQHLELRPA